MKSLKLVLQEEIWSEQGAIIVLEMRELEVSRSSEPS